MSEYLDNDNSEVKLFNIPEWEKWLESNPSQEEIIAILRIEIEKVSKNKDVIYMFEAACIALKKRGVLPVSLNKYREMISDITKLNKIRPIRKNERVDRKLVNDWKVWVKGKMYEYRKTTERTRIVEEVTQELIHRINKNGRVEINAFEAAIKELGTMTTAFPYGYIVSDAIKKTPNKKMAYENEILVEGNPYRSAA